MYKRQNLYESLLEVENIPGLERAATKVRKFTDLIENFKDQQQSMSLKELVNEVLNLSLIHI